VHASHQVSRELTIEPEAIVKAAIKKLGSVQHKIQFKTTHDGGVFCNLGCANQQLSTHKASKHEKIL
jgi:hypothetical protein